MRAWPGFRGRPATAGSPLDEPVGGVGVSPADRAWLAAYPDRRRLLAARRRRVEQALFLEEERAAAWRRLRLASWGAVAGGLALVAAGVPAHADLGFLAGSVLFVLGALGLVADRVGEAERAGRRERLLARLDRLVRRGDLMDTRARRIGEALGVDPWGAALPGKPGPASRAVSPPAGAR